MVTTYTDHKYGVVNSGILLNQQEYKVSASAPGSGFRQKENTNGIGSGGVGTGVTSLTVSAR